VVTPITGNTYRGLKINTGALELSAEEISLQHSGNSYWAQTTDVQLLVRENVGGTTQDVWRTFEFVNGMLVQY
jgi:hypothetical protein